VTAFPPVANVTADSVVSSGSAVLKIVEPRVNAVLDGRSLSSASSDPDRNGRARPGAKGLVAISGIGLAGATAIQFEGDGVSGEIVDNGKPTELNPLLTAMIQISETASTGPRRFTITTPRGTVASSDVVFVVQEPTISGIFDSEGSPDSTGRVEVIGVGLESASAIVFSDPSVTGTIQPLKSDQESYLNPSVPVDLKIAADAVLGEQSFTVKTSRGAVASDAVKFKVVNPRIDAIFEGNNFLGGQGFSLSGEGAPGTAGDAVILGVGLGGAKSLDFSGDGVSGTLRPTLPEQLNELNPAVIATVKIDPTAALGERTFSLAIPRGAGKVLSNDNQIKFIVTGPRVDFIADERNFSQAAPGACGMVSVGGVGLREATKVEFDAPGGIMAGVISNQEPQPFLNDPVAVSLNIAATATMGARSFVVTTLGATVGSGRTIFTVSPARIFIISAEEPPVVRSSASRAVLTAKQMFAERRLIAHDGRFSFSSQQVSLGNEAAPGSSGSVMVIGVGLLGPTATRFSGGGINSTLAPNLSRTLNPAVALNIDINRAVALGERTFDLSITGADPQCR
jgi:hypothetical protein